MRLNNISSKSSQSQKKSIFRSIFLYKTLFFVCIQGLLGLQQVYATTYYVSPSGNNSNNGTSLSTPLKTISAGLDKANSGDIVYVLTGTYPEVAQINQDGITLSAYPGNSPVIDGGNNLPNEDWMALVYISGDNNTVSGFEVKNSNVNGAYLGGYGIQSLGHHNKLSKMNVHHTWETGVLVQGDYGILEDSTVSQAALQNKEGTSSGGWGNGVSAARNQSSTALIRDITSYPIIRRNKVFNNWGEGIDCFEADHCIIEDNIIYDNWTHNLYLSDCPNSLVQRNLVYVSSNPAIPRRDGDNTGITLADEVTSVPRSANNTIINNFVFNADISAFGWTNVSGSGLNNVLIANNTVIDGGLLTGSINSNSQIRNNIFNGGSSIPSKSGITFSNNYWKSGGASSSSDVIGDPQLARTGAITAGALTPSYFKISGSSPMIDRALPLAIVKVDFFSATRGNYPDIGGSEFGSTTTAQLPPTAIVPPKVITPPPVVLPPKVITPPPAVALSILSSSVSNITSSAATIKWSTNMPASGSVSYGTNVNNLSSKITVSNLATSHSVQITRLARSTTYYYNISAKSGSATALSATSSFRSAGRYARR